jgi:two-component system phosphate regulon sensor histidine kinase PhoR
MILLLILSDGTTFWGNLIISLIVSSIISAVYYTFINRYITDRLRILYRSIRKGKFDSENRLTIDSSGDAIEKAELETKKWTDERMQEISKLKEQEEYRREFLGNLAHELKTPVFSIQGYILTLLEGGLEDETINRTFLERASKATDRMTSILEDLDQLTKFEVNEIALDIQRFDIYELVKDIFEDLEMKAKKKKIKLKFEKDDYTPILVKADRNKIAQVLTNLISNSISYGHEGGRTKVRFYVMDDIVTIEVSDDGLGIEESHIPRLFERFYRVEKSRNRNEGGSGLGLAIAKHIIEAHGQTINVRSTLGVGSTFTFSLDKAKK